MLNFGLSGLRILWFPRLQLDIDKLHIKARTRFCAELEKMGCIVKLALSGQYGKAIYNKIDVDYIKVPIIPIKVLRFLTFLVFGFGVFIFSYFKFKPVVLVFDIYSLPFSLPLLPFYRKKCLFILDNRTPYFNQYSSKSSGKDIFFRLYTNFCFYFAKQFFSGLTVIADHYKDEIINKFNFSNEKVEVWGSGVDSVLFDPNRFEGIERPEFLRGKFVVMQHGELSRNRGILEAIEALSMVSNSDICLLLIGDAVGNSSIIEELEALINNLRLSERVFILPPVSHEEIPKYIYYSDCAVMAYPQSNYWNNNHPLKLLEYLAMNKTIICSAMPVFKNIMRDAKCAIYLEDNSPSRISASFDFAYLNKVNLSFWGQEGRKIIETSNLTWGGQASRFLNFVNRLRG